MSLRAGITVAIPVHPPRVGRQLHRALDSVQMQQRLPDALAVAVDHTHAGGAATRNEALDMVNTKWTAFLDSDDTMNPDHLKLLMQHQRDTGADLVYSWFDVVNGWDPFPQYEGRPFDPEALRTVQNFIPVTVLVRTDLLREVGGFIPLGPPDNPCEDWGAWKAMLAAGATFAHLPRRTWNWIWGENTSGRGDAW
jgi:glycosyltransferase involved in cell wall biosynthesis